MLVGMVAWMYVNNVIRCCWVTSHVNLLPLRLSSAFLFLLSLTTDAGGIPLSCFPMHQTQFINNIDMCTIL
jgi:hypothetical protein